ncbi:hypothetical protein E5675_12885 [Sphingopyxis sp. PAMC25046]|uniref:hypothetical protein n=1 Tax=Sphingopyxis sp. PAMC25046 TaxID=2565556 RepID=UPI00109E202D|nr:hypothetical protein [Sphingopyxis sp. PAMC25046]QCB55239.1 hypothetical protein E5675_12885 [Sphingopyxis sp. PAMC25046]
MIRGVKAASAGFQPFTASGQPPKVGRRFAEGAKPHRALPQLEAATGRLTLRDLQREIGAFRLEINALGLTRGVILEQNIKGPHVEYLG